MAHMEIITQSPSLELRPILINESAVVVQPITEAVIQWQSPMSSQSPKVQLGMNEKERPQQVETANKTMGLGLMNKWKTERLKKSLKASSIFVNGNFQCQFCASRDLTTDLDVSWLITETAKRSVDTDSITVQPKKDDSGIVQTKAFVEAFPFAVLLATQVGDETKIEEYVDKGSEHESPLSAICSQRLLQLLYYLGLDNKNFGIAANIIIVSNSPVIDLSGHSSSISSSSQTSKDQLMKHLDFFREKARDFLIKQFVTHQKAALQFGTTINEVISSENRGRIALPLARLGARSTAFTDQRFLKRDSNQRPQSQSSAAIKSPISRFLMSTRGNGQKTAGQHGFGLQISPSQYISEQILTDATPLSIRNRFAQVQTTQRHRQKPLITLKKEEVVVVVVSQKTKKNTRDQALILKLQQSFKLSETDYQEALVRYQAAIRELQKTHLIEIKNLRQQSQMQLAHEMLSFVLKLRSNGTKQHSQEEIRQVIQSEGLKKLMVTIDPFNNISLTTAVEILDQIDSQEAKYKPISLNRDPQASTAVKCMLKFVYNACIIAVGTRVFDYDRHARSPTQVLETVERSETITSPQFFSDQEMKTTKGDTLQSPMSFQSRVRSHNSMHKRCKTSEAKGTFLKPKHLYFSNENRQLQVAHYIPATLPIFNMHETLPKHVLRDHFDEVELPDIDLYNFNEVSLARYVPKSSPILRQYNTAQVPKAYDFNEIQSRLGSLPQSNAGILEYSKGHDPNELPTAVLIKLADLMKQRRVDIYEHNDVNLTINKKIFSMK